LLKSLKT